MADERISSIATQQPFDELKRLNEGPEAVIANMLKANANARNLGDALKSTNGLKGVVDAQAKLELGAQRLAQAQAKTNQALSNAEAAQARAAAATLRAAQAQERAAAAADKQAQATQKAAAQNNVARDSNVALSKTLNDLRAGYDRLTEAERKNENIGGVLVARIKELDTQLKASDASTGRFQRNVGSYEGAVSGFKLQVQQVARELPSLNNGINTFISAIGNNLPMAQEALTRLREENARLRAEGKPTTSVLKTLAGSIFNWQTALIVLLTVLPSVVKAMSNFSFGSDKAAKNLAKLTEEQNKLSKSTGDYAGQEISQLQTLRSRIENLNLPMANRLQAIKDLQEQFPQYFKGLSQEALPAGNVGNAYIKATDAIIASARVRTFGDELSKKVSELTALGDRIALQTQKAGITLSKLPGIGGADGGFIAPDVSLTYPTGEKDKNGKAIRSDLIRDVAKYNQLLGDQANLVQRIKDNQPALVKLDDPEKPKRLRDLTNENLKAETDYTKAVYEEMQERAQLEAEVQRGIFEDDTKTLQERLDAYQKFTEKQIEAAGFRLSGEYEATQETLNKIAQIEAKAADKRTNEEKNLLLQKDVLNQKLENLEAEYNLAVRKLINDLSKYRQNETEKDYKEQVRLAKEYAPKIAAAFGYAQDSGKVRGRKKDNGGILNFGDEEKRNLENISAYSDAAAAALGGVVDVLDQISQRRIAAIQREEDELDKLTDKQIEAVNDSVANEDVKQAKISEIKARAAAKQEALDEKARQEQRKAAEREKALTIAKIIVETALAVVHQLGSGDPYTAVARGVAAGAIGAAQLAAAIATPIPQYATGTEDHPGGPAMLHKDEIVREQDGTLWHTGKRKETYVPNLSRHAQVFPGYPDMDTFLKSTYGMAINGGIVTKNYNEYDGRNVEQKLEAVGRNIVTAIRTKETVNLKEVTSFYDPRQFDKIRRK